MTISNESRVTHQGDLRADRPRHGPPRAHPQRPDPHRLRDHRRRRHPRRAPAMARRRDRRLHRRRLRHVRWHARPGDRPGQQLGAFMDSVFDRWGEVIVYLGIIAGVRGRRAARTSPILARPRRWARPSWSATPGPSPKASASPSGIGHGRGRGHAPRDPARDPVARPRPRRDEHRHLVLEFALGIIAIGATITVIQRILHVRSQAKSAATPHRSSEGSRENHVSKNATARTAARRPTPGPGPGGAATARSASPSSASATAPAAWSRAATTTRTPRRPTSSRA